MMKLSNVQFSTSSFIKLASDVIIFSVEGQKR